MVSAHLKNISQNWNLPQVGVKIKNISNHHLEYLERTKTSIWRFQSSSSLNDSTEPVVICRCSGAYDLRWALKYHQLRHITCTGTCKIYIYRLNFNTTLLKTSFYKNWVSQTYTKMLQWFVWELSRSFHLFEILGQLSLKSLPNRLIYHDSWNLGIT